MNPKQQLRELVRHIVREALQELMSQSPMSSTTSIDQQNSMDQLTNPSLPPMDSMTPYEKAKQERDQEKVRRDALEAREAEMKSLKSKMDSGKKELDQEKRFKLPTLNKQIQSLKGGQVGSAM